MDRFGVVARVVLVAIKLMPIMDMDRVVAPVAGVAAAAPYLVVTA